MLEQSFSTDACPEVYLFEHVPITLTVHVG